MMEEREKLRSNVAERTRERVFLDSSVLLTAVCHEHSDSAILLQRCKEGNMLGIVSQRVLYECNWKLKYHPELFFASTFSLFLQTPSAAATQGNLRVIFH